MGAASNGFSSKTPWKMRLGSRCGRDWGLNKAAPGISLQDVAGAEVVWWRKGGCWAKLVSCWQPFVYNPLTSPPCRGVSLVVRR